MGFGLTLGALATHGRIPVSWVATCCCVANPSYFQWQKQSKAHAITTWDKPIDPVRTLGLFGSHCCSSLQATSSAFAALRQDGTVHTWGLAHKGGDSSVVKDAVWAFYLGWRQWSYRGTCCLFQEFWIALYCFNDRIKERQQSQCNPRGQHHQDLKPPKPLYTVAFRSCILK